MICLPFLKELFHPMLVVFPFEAFSQIFFVLMMLDVKYSLFSLCIVVFAVWKLLLSIFMGSCILENASSYFLLSL